MAARFPMAVVVTGSPLTVTIEGTSAVVAAEDFVGGLTTGDRVQAAFLGDRLTVLAKAGGGGDTGWTGVTFRSGWENVASIYPFEVRKLNGVIYATGLVQKVAASIPASTGVIIADLPSWAIPQYATFLALGTTTGQVNATGQFRDDGAVEIRSGAGTLSFVGFGGLSWPAA